tara:strand:+ start:48 stop:350 length:303 start_codon:yes stop_codon:yes gene_type:complete
MIDSIADAIKELAKECSYKYDSVNDKLTINSITPSTVKEADIRKKAKELEDEFTSQEYSRKRSIAYPPIGDQLDDLYHKGAFSTEMATKLKKVKDDFPKG